MTTDWYNHVYRAHRSLGCLKSVSPTFRGLALRMTPSWKEVWTTLKHHILRCQLPYGKWTCEDGREGLFNRNYEPIWEKYPEKPARAANPKEWVNYVKQEYLYQSDRYAPWYDNKTLKDCLTILFEFTKCDLRSLFSGAINLDKIDLTYPTSSTNYSLRKDHAENTRPGAACWHDR